MKVCRLVKRFRNCDNHEERVMAHALIEGAAALDIVVDYLAMQVDQADKVLTNTKELYTATGDNHLYVATLLAKREANMNLLLLLTDKVELDVDQTKG